jgi:uncharacterized protein YkwD
MDRGRTGHGRWLAAAALVVGTLLLLALAPARLDAEASESRGTAPARVVARPDLRDDLLLMTNADRATGARGPLSLEERLSRYAERHSQRMARLGSIFHSSRSQLEAALGGDGWTVAGENVGVGASLAGVEEAFMDSPAHRANVLDASFEVAAIGVAESGGVVWVTVIFVGS